ncbi:flagellar basal-body MS-ring/collar protein FliF [Shimia sp.]|uniref:flagellar basal-body MS-ring/collar protein FliF n=1 Tax=Shimia sp. TaxID=1954381 RepID=UPI00329A2D2A
MQQILSIWSGLDTRRKIIVVGATALMFVAVLSLGRMASRPGMTLLYSGLESSAAGEVVRALEQRGAVFQVEGGSIYVDSSMRDELRMTLASEGLPANTTQGYELLDALSGFGTTSQMFDAAYWRAKEGELARTILGSPSITTARVHIAHTGSNPFQRQLQPTASVTITSTGGGLPPRQAQALKFLVASAVAGLSPDDVAVIDGSSGIIGSVDDPAAHSQDDRADTLRSAVQRLLEARVGPGNAVVEVSVETVNQTESILERTFDPAGRVAISTETEERSTNSENAASGQVTVASNLPDGDASENGTSTNRDSETHERVNYEVSETQREITREPGAIRRLTVAVLVNGTTTENDAGEAVLTVRPEEELTELHDLVASAVGFNEERGDVITLKSMLFQPIKPLGTAASTSFFGSQALNAMSLIQMAILAIVSIVLGLFVVRPLLSKPQSLPSPLEAAAQISSVNVDEPNSSTVLDGEIEDLSATALPPKAVPSSDRLPALAQDMTQSDAVERLRALISDRQEETVEILRNWLDYKEENV